MGSALALTGVAIGLLILIAVVFIFLTWGLGWPARRTRRERVEEPEVSTLARRKAIIAAAVTSYLESEHLGEADSEQEGRK
jgi:Na+-transporting methylmalonyl-CoA/oxaloacetate decarboxylase gamma subunit